MSSIGEFSEIPRQALKSNIDERRKLPDFEGERKKN